MGSSATEIKRLSEEFVRRGLCWLAVRGFIVSHSVIRLDITGNVPSDPLRKTVTAIVLTFTSDGVNLGAEMTGKLIMHRF